MTVYVLSYRDKLPGDVPVINTTSRSTNWSKGLSPMVVGPVMANGTKCYNVENAWQYSKVYTEHVGKNGKPTLEYYEWRNKGYNSTWAHRYPMGKGAKPAYSWWNRKKLGYIDARKEIYIPLYASAVITTEAFQNLITFYEEYNDIVLLDFDAYDHRKLKMSWSDVIHNPYRNMGHAFVLAMMLEGVI
jgi:hypothetical protein